jgi:hypothetical protein
MTEPKRTVHVRSHYRDGHRVRAHSRRLDWKSVGATWAVVGFSSLTTLALLAEFGLEMVSMIAIIITALFGLLATWVTTKATEKQRQMRAKTAPPPRRRKGNGRRPTTTRSRTRR